MGYEIIPKQRGFFSLGNVFLLGHLLISNPNIVVTFNTLERFTSSSFLASWNISQKRSAVATSEIPGSPLKKSATSSLILYQNQPQAAKTWSFIGPSFQEVIPRVLQSYYINASEIWQTHSPVDIWKIESTFKNIRVFLKKKTSPAILNPSTLYHWLWGHHEGSELIPPDPHVVENVVTADVVQLSRVWLSWNKPGPPKQTPWELV